MKRFAIATIALFGPLAAFAQQDQPAQDRKPRIYLDSKSHGNVWSAKRDQSIEMAKDFESKCPETKITIVPEKADYTVILNHIEVGAFGRNNQMEVADKNGDVLTTHDKGGIKGGVKEVCKVILADWASHQPSNPDKKIEGYWDPAKADPAKPKQQ
jgi:hypothetical protein